MPPTEQPPNTQQNTQATPSQVEPPTVYMPSAIPQAVGLTEYDSSSDNPHKKIISAGIIVLVLVLSAIAIIVFAKKPAPVAPTQKLPATNPSLTQPAVLSQPTAKTAAPAKSQTGLVATTYNNGKGRKFSLLFYKNADQRPATSLSARSTMAFIAGNENILEGSGNSSKSPLTMNIDTGGVDNKCKPVFTVRISGAGSVPVCGDKTLYTLDFKVKGESYFVSVMNLAETDLTSYNSDLKKILSSIKPL